MGADRGRRAAGVLLALAFLATGCASMPSGGEVVKVETSPRAEHESRVRVYGESPEEGQQAPGIVRGFLEATTSDESQYKTAKEYLTEEAARNWDPFAGTTVIEGGPTTGSDRADVDENGGKTVKVSGRRTARLDGRHAYHSQDGPFSTTFHLIEVKGEGWRIDALPDGLILGESDFERIYRSVDTFYFARLGPDRAAVPRGDEVLVAQPVYVRSRIGPLAETVRALLDGPINWLRPVVTTAFPDRARLAKRRSVSVDDSGGVTVRLNRHGARVDKDRCARMAAQVFHSVQSQASAAVKKVELQGPGGGRVCALPSGEADLFQPGRLGARGPRPYLIDGGNRVASIQPGGEEPEPVLGPLGTGEVQFRSVGVSRDEKRAAAVSLDGTRLYVAPMSAQAKRLTVVAESEAPGERDRLSAPSWDGLGDLWVADRDPDDPRLLRIPGGDGEPQEVSVSGMGKFDSIRSLRISSDGVRIALRVRGPDGENELKLGRVERRGTPENPSVSVTALQPVAPQLEDVVAMSWSGHSELVVLGKEARGVQQLQYVGTDGSTTHQPPLPGINDVSGVAASAASGRALLAEADSGIVRLPPDDPDWETVAPDGKEPVYPG